MNAIAVIPARGGSKRIPRKNLIEIGGKPMLEHTIDIAIRSAAFDEVFVSTDDSEITAIARNKGAIPLPRSAVLSEDNTPILPVIQDAISRTRHLVYDAVCMLLPTAIFLSPRTIWEAKKMLEVEGGLEYVITVEQFSSAPQRALTLTISDHVNLKNKAVMNTRSQDLEPLFHDAGQMSFGTRKAWITGQHSFTANTKAIRIPKYSSVDIDTPDDLEFARKLFSLR